MGNMGSTRTSQTNRSVSKALSSGSSHSAVSRKSLTPTRLHNKPGRSSKVVVTSGFASPKRLSKVSTSTGSDSDAAVSRKSLTPTLDDVAAAVYGQGVEFALYSKAMTMNGVDGRFLRRCTNQQLSEMLRGPIGVQSPDHVATLTFLLRALQFPTAGSPQPSSWFSGPAQDTHEQLDILMRAGNALFQTQRLVAARALYERALEGYERVVGPDHASTIGVVNNLGALAVIEGRQDDALMLLNWALTGREQLLGFHHERTLITCQMLANLHHGQQRWDDALELYIRCAAGYAETHGPGHDGAIACREKAEDICKDCLRRSAALNKSGRLNEAVVLGVKARDGYARCLGEDHASTLAATTALAVLHENLDHFEKAKALYLRALEGTERSVGSGHVRALNLVSALAHLHRNHGMPKEANKYFVRALAGYESTYGSQHLETMNLRREFGYDHIVIVEAVQPKPQNRKWSMLNFSALTSRKDDGAHQALPSSRKWSIRSFTSRKDV